MISSRELILARIRQRLGSPGAPAAPLPGNSGRPAPSSDPAAWRERFLRQARSLGSEVHPCPHRDDVLPTLKCLLDGWPDMNRVAWPALRPWLENATLNCRFGQGNAHDQIGITGCAGAIAETGSLIMTTGPDTPGSVSLLPEIHVALVSHRDIVEDLEMAWHHLAQRADWPPRGVTLVSGPSRTADIEQQVVIGAHGPGRVIILLYPD